MITISPKLIDVEGNRIGTDDNFFLKTPKKKLVEDRSSYNIPFIGTTSAQ